MRIATIVAVFRGSKVLELEDLDWAIKVARRSTSQIAQGLSKHMLEEFEQADLVEYIRELFRKLEVVRIGQINKHCERKTGDYRKISTAINHLISCEEIVGVEDPGGPGRPTERWRWMGISGQPNQAQNPMRSEVNSKETQKGRGPTAPPWAAPILYIIYIL